MDSDCPVNLLFFMDRKFFQKSNNKEKIIQITCQKNCN